MFQIVINTPYPMWSVLLDSKYADLQVPDVNIQGWTTWKYYSAYILMQLMCVHVNDFLEKMVSSIAYIILTQ